MVFGQSRSPIQQARDTGSRVSFSCERSPEQDKRNGSAKRLNVGRTARSATRPPGRVLESVTLRLDDSQPAAANLSRLEERSGGEPGHRQRKNRRQNDTNEVVGIRI